MKRLNSTLKNIKMFLVYFFFLILAVEITKRAVLEFFFSYTKPEVVVRLLLACALTTTDCQVGSRGRETEERLQGRLTTHIRAKHSRY